MRILKKSSTFAAVSIKKARCVTVSPPIHVGEGIKTPAIISMDKKNLLIDANGNSVDVAAFRALVCNESLCSDYFGGKSFKRASLSWVRDWCEKELKKRTRHVENLSTLLKHVKSVQAAADAAEEQ